MERSNKFHRDKTKILHHKVIQTDVKKKSAFPNMNKATLTNFSLEKPLSNNHHLKTVFPSSFSPQLETSAAFLSHPAFLPCYDPETFWIFNI